MEWISVNDKLPEFETDVIVYYEYYSNPVLVAAIYEWSVGKFRWTDGDGYSIAPTHWMPLPEPPINEAEKETP